MCIHTRPGTHVLQHLAWFRPLLQAPAPGSFPSPPLVAVHRVRWSHSANSSGGGGGGSGIGGKAEDGAATAGWLAHGGAAGLVCLQHLP